MVHRESIDIVMGLFGPNSKAILPVEDDDRGMSVSCENYCRREPWFLLSLGLLLR